MDKMDHLMAENNENNKDIQKGQVTPKKIYKKNFNFIVLTPGQSQYRKRRIQNSKIFQRKSIEMKGMIRGKN